MAEAGRQGLPLLRLNGGLNTNVSPVAMEPTDAREIVNLDLEVGGSLARRGIVDFIGESSYGGFLSNVQADDPATEFQMAAPATHVFSAVVGGETQKWLCLHSGNFYEFYRFDDLTELRDIGAPRYQLMQSTWAPDVRARYARTKFESDRGKVFVLNEYSPLVYFYWNGTGFARSYITPQRRNLDIGASSFVNHNGVSYACIRAHMADSNTEPGVGGNWKTAWYRFGPKAEDDINPVPNWSSGTNYGTNIETIDGRFTAMAFSSGRLWLSGNSAHPSTVYFSQTVDNDLKYGRMFAAADPLNTYDSELVDTDGGSLDINGADQIVAITAYRTGLIVFATNGIWHIHGAADMYATFRATDFAIDKVSDTGIVGPDCYVKTEETIMFFGYGGVYILEADSLASKITAKPVSNKIEDFYTTLPLDNRQRALAVYNPAKKRAYFLCNFDKQEHELADNPLGVSTRWHDALVFDFRTGGWTTYRLGRKGRDDLAICGMMSVAANGPLNSYVVTQDGDSVIDGDGNLIVSYYDTPASTQYIDIVVLGRRNGDVMEIALGLTDQEGESDFGSSSEFAMDLEWRFASAHINVQDLFHTKRIPHMTFVFERTESGILDENGNDVTAGGCLMTPLFNWETASRNSGATRQLYRANRYNIARYDGADPGREVVVVKEHIRGRGKSFQFILENDGSKQMRLHGIHLMVQASKRG